MLEQIAQRYLTALDEELRRVIDSAPVETPGYGVMLRYPMGWVDADGQPNTIPTGKRVRPILLLLCCEAAGGTLETGLPAAAAVELLHNFSLVHDDIQDNSLTRHGRPTVWQVWGSANGINAGDALFALSYKALSDLALRAVPAETVLQAWQIYNATAIELTRGQHLDMRFETQPIVTTENYISMIGGKTAALLSCCAEIGALVGCHDRVTAAHYADFGLNLGISFQIRDDILGIWGDPEKTGKSAATDIVSRKKSLPVLYGLMHSNDLATLYRKDTFSETDVTDAVRLLDAAAAQEYALQQEKKFYDRALESLAQADPQGNAAHGLRLLIDTLFARSH